MKRVLQKKKKVAPRLSRDELQAANLRFMGAEPSFKSKELTNEEIEKAKSWYHNMCDTDIARVFVENFLNKNGLKKIAVESKQIQKAWFPTWAAWIMQLVNRGYKIDSDRVKRAIEGVVKEIEDAKKRSMRDDPFKTASENEKTIAVKKVEKKSVIADIEDILDMHTRGEIKTYNLYNKLVADRISMDDAKAAIAYYQPILDEYVAAALPKADKQLVEGYLKNGKAAHYERGNFIKALIDDLISYTTVKKTVRKVRAIKPVSIEKKIKNFKYQKQDPDLKVVSTDPAKIVGSKACYMFNTKNRVMSVYIAEENKTLDIQNNKIINYSIEKSKSKRIGKKPETVLLEIMKAPKNLAIKIFDNVKNISNDVTGRSNDTTIIVRLL